MNWRNRSTSLFQMLGIATSLAWSNAHTASRRRCLGIRGTLEIGVATSQDAADPPLRYPACNLSVEPSSTKVLARWRTGAIRWSSFRRKAPARAALVCPSRPRMARSTSVPAGIASDRPALERVQLVRQHERLLAGPDHADQKQHEDQLAD